MSKHYATIKWSKNATEKFIDHKYSRAHCWYFDGGAVIHASSSPNVVPLPYSMAENVDPEEAFIASVSSCHMLFFLSIAAKKKFKVKAYTDEAWGTMQTNKHKKTAITQIFLQPRIEFSGTHKPSEDEIVQMHKLSHDQCFIANSILTEITIT